jgi:hypothetical protein
LPVFKMSVTQTFRLRDYELACSARAIDNGRFEPTLIVTRNVWPSRPRTIAMQRGDFQSVASAIESARAQGIEWVANYGMPETPRQKSTS